MTAKNLSNRLLVVIEVIAMLVFAALVALFAHMSDTSPHQPNPLTGQTNFWIARGHVFYVHPLEHTVLDNLLKAVVGLWIVVGAWWAVHWIAFRERPDRDHWFGKFTAILVILAIVGSLAHAWYFRATG